MRVEITRLDHAGAGVADTGYGPLVVPGALPGETVEAERQSERHARLVAIETPSPDRVAPPCPHFGVCGGCVAQHMGGDLYRRFKLSILEGALAQHRLTAAIAPLVMVPPGARRRVVLALARTDEGPVLGFHAPRSETIVPIAACLVATPAIVAALPVLLRLLGPLARARPGTVTVLDTASGLDVALSEVSAGPKERERLVVAAREADLARLSIDGQVLATFRAPVLDMGGVAVTPPPGGFVQAVAAAETVLAREAAAMLGKAKTIADLFAGAGAFTFRIAKTAKVHAVEGDAAALSALETARDRVQGLKPVATERRDLYRRPLTVTELNRFDAVLLDPPRQGAEAQIREIARSKLGTVVYVSCAPGTFARDARILVEAGFGIERIVPVDQFLWSGHLEKIAAFRR